MKIYDNSEIRTRAPEDQMELIPDSGALDRSAMLPAKFLKCFMITA